MPSLTAASQQREGRLEASAPLDRQHPCWQKGPAGSQRSLSQQHWRSPSREPGDGRGGVRKSKRQPRRTPGIAQELYYFERQQRIEGNTGLAEATGLNRDAHRNPFIPLIRCCHRVLDFSGFIIVEL